MRTHFANEKLTDSQGYDAGTTEGVFERPNEWITIKRKTQWSWDHVRIVYLTRWIIPAPHTKSESQQFVHVGFLFKAVYSDWSYIVHNMRTYLNLIYKRHNSCINNARGYSSFIFCNYLDKRSFFKQVQCYHVVINLFM